MRNISILLVDDHQIVREGLRAILASRIEWKICGEADNGRTAVTMSAATRPDVVILDFAMPDLNGLEAARQIRGISSDTEILMLTMHNSDRLIRECVQSGVKGFLFKNDVAKNLVSAVDALARHETFFAPEVSSLILSSYLLKNTSSPQDAHSVERLTTREREVVQLVAEGKTTKEIALILGISEKTIETHRTNVLRRLKLRSAIDLVRYAIRNHIIEP
jgi:DNA-binding NarL/FixJ family response regulator